MNTKLIMASTAILFGIIGIFLTFAPDTVTGFLGVNDSTVVRLILQLLGAAYYAFAMLNWMAKGALIGGIYNRPIATANLTHFLVGGLAMGKAVSSDPQLPVILWIVASFYIIGACLFGILISRHPIAAAA
jgi:hypothetical protein